MSSHTYVLWNESSFDVQEGCEDATFPDAILVAACEETPAMIKVAIERCFLGVDWNDATQNVRADGLVLNAIIWVMRQTDYTDYQSVMDAYKMLPHYEECFRAMRDEDTMPPLETVNFDQAEWEARYQQS